MYDRIIEESVVAHALDRWRDAADSTPRQLPSMGAVRAAWISSGAHCAISACPPQRGYLYDDAGRVLPGFDTADVVIAAAMRIDGPILDQLSCRMLMCPSVGYNGVDIAAATARGIVVCNIPDAYSEEVALQAIAFLMAANRQLPAFEQSLRAGHCAQTGIWRRSIIIHNPRVQTVGIVGFRAHWAHRGGKGAGYRLQCRRV